MRIKFQINSKSSILRGFTLIELLVVIAIISVLSALLLSNFVGIRQRGRDGQRKSDLSQLQAALELYRADNGAYPVAPLPTCGTQLADALGNTVYMKKIPCDPLGVIPPADPWVYKYAPAVDQFSYTISACIENNADPKKDTSSVISGCASTYTIENP